jgi:hypothetical protein
MSDKIEADRVEDVPDNYTLITGSFEVQHVLAQCGYKHGERTGVGLFVRTNDGVASRGDSGVGISKKADDGAYTDVLAFEGCVPRLRKSVERIK